MTTGFEHCSNSRRNTDTTSFRIRGIPVDMDIEVGLGTRTDWQRPGQVFCTSCSSHAERCWSDQHHVPKWCVVPTCFQYVSNWSKVVDGRHHSTSPDGFRLLTSRSQWWRQSITNSSSRLSRNLHSRHTQWWKLCSFNSHNWWQLQTELQYPVNLATIQILKSRVKNAWSRNAWSPQCCERAQMPLFHWVAGKALQFPGHSWAIQDTIRNVFQTPPSLVGLSQKVRSQRRKIDFNCKRDGVDFWWFHTGEFAPTVDSYWKHVRKS